MSALDSPPRVRDTMLNLLRYATSIRESTPFGIEELDWRIHYSHRTPPALR